MSNLMNSEKIGLRDKKTNKIVVVYPLPVEGTDEEIIKLVKNWYYVQSCNSEERLLSLYVDSLTEAEIKERN